MGKLNFSLTQLEYVLAVYQKGHFAQAAEACYVTQPTLSMQIQKLEEALGIKIFDRTKKPIRLTLEGEAIIDAIRRAVWESKNIEEILNQIKQQDIAGELSVGVIPTVAPYVLPKALREHQRSNPKIILKIVELQTEHILDRLKNDQLDLGILAIPIENNQLVTEHLFYEPFYVFCRKDHELARYRQIKTQQLSHQDLWLLEEGHCLRQQVLEACRFKNRHRTGKVVYFEAGSLEMIGELIKEMGGYTLIPESAIARFREMGKVVPIAPPSPSREIGFVYSRKYYKSRLIEQFKRNVLKSLPNVKETLDASIKVIPVVDPSSGLRYKA
ncbi:MAG: LysR substrate-binding domain-containing protein [Bdellovibrionaceae bacterium]|nr:LysR substrate-binding domain-containing protein [Pseudobdellovibrionaceae bacterium]MDW8190544.1 LysR substrate-binding domain-containing protein [Pseudobdellovibrionaceae bacterium]